jgi:hypothetical protein
MSNSNLVNIPNAPILPLEAYFDIKIKDDNNPSVDVFSSVSGEKVINNIGKVCTDFKDKKGIDDELLSSNSIYTKTMNGSAVKDDPLITGNDAQKCKDHIQYLACQLAEARTRIYDSNTFQKNSGDMSISEIFKTFSNLKPYLIIVFFLTIFLFINGIFGSMDVVGNVFNVIEKNSSMTLTYWMGLLIGLAIPVILLCIFYSKIVCGSLKDLEKYNITKNPRGDKEIIEAPLRNLDITMIVLFIFVIYCFTAILFTVKRDSVGDTLYTAIVGSVMLVLAVFFYLMYAYIPFFSTAGTDDKTPRELKLFIDQQEDTSDITTNQHQDDKIKKTFIITFIIIFIFAIIFFIIGKYDMANTILPKFIIDFFSGLFGSSAILVIPAIWVLNFILAIKYFYIYPIILIIFRFIRYVAMLLLYLMSEKFVNIKDSFSDELIYQLDNFKNYSPTWGLIGVDVIKGLLNTMGYDNIFSKMITDNNNDNKNISQNKYISSGLLKFFISSNMSGMIFSGVVFAISIIISIIILYGIAKI